MNVMSFRTHFATAPTGSVDLVVMPADRMRVERLSTQVLPPSQRGPGAVKAHPESWVLLWLFCAATRQLGDTGLSFDQWADTVTDYERLDADGNPAKSKSDGPVEDPAVDPTQPTASTSSP